ncbi:MAG: Polyhydroxyalkanoic acid synthase [Myxococcaceae bacterium]|nr:Polyhydroxyalkanoic acid synthase [Myxococcaceae bacterium]
MGHTDGLEISHETTSNGDGWELSLRRTVARHARAHDDVGPARPVLIVPGYGMNSFIFGFHPTGRSLEHHLAWRGFEVWSVDFRAQGRSRSTGGAMTGWGLAELATVDTSAAVAHVLARTATGSAQVDLIGCSLGTAIMLAHAVLDDRDRLGSLVAFGGPLRWTNVHPLVAVAFRSPRLAAAIPFRGTRRLAAMALPLLLKTPLLSIYLNPRSSDMSRWREMIATVEDPIPQINGEIAQWILDRDLTIHGTNITSAVEGLTNPLLCVVARQDGIVPVATARSPYVHSGTAVKAMLEVGEVERPHAHADLFLSREAEARVFEPLARWLSRPTSGIVGV